MLYFAALFKFYKMPETKKANIFDVCSTFDLFLFCFVMFWLCWTFQQQENCKSFFLENGVL